MIRPADDDLNRNGLSEPDDDKNSLEANIVELAISGKLADAARQAVGAQIQKGLAITFKRGDQVIRRHPDGREEVLGTLERSTFRVPPGVQIIEEK